jgi:uncharacterized protein
LELLTKISGTLINILTILLGTSLGLILKKHLADSSRKIIIQSISLLTLWLGFDMTNYIKQANINDVDGFLLAILTMVIGGLLGEFWQIEEKLYKIGNWIKKKINTTGNFTQGLVDSSLLFCIGPMSIIGSFNNGINGDPSILILKAIMDGIVAISLSSKFGIGVGFSAITILLYQGSLSLMAGLVNLFIVDPANNPAFFLMSGVGGVLIVGLGLNLLEVTKLKIASFIPCLFLAPLIYWLFDLIF